jgi:hypothetical protein
MFENEIRVAGLKLLAEHPIQEGIEVAAVEDAIKVIEEAKTQPTLRSIASLLRKEESDT